MSEREPDVSPALAAARSRRERLHGTLVRAEEAISSPAPGRMADWSNDVTKALLELRDAFEAHVEATEAPGGLYEEILTAAPRLAGKVARLGEEHPVILGAIDERIEGLAVPSDDDDVDAARDAVQRVLGRVVRHRQHGADLVWEAYNLDIGGPE